MFFRDVQPALLQSAAYAIFSTGMDGTISTWNRAAERLLGYTAEEVVGKATPTLFHHKGEIAARAGELGRGTGQASEADLNAISLEASHFETILGQTKSCGAEEREWTYVSKPGYPIPVLVSTTAVVEPDGGMAGFLWVAKDISERRRAEQQLEDARLRSRELFEGNPLPAFVYDMHTYQMLDVNEAALQHYGYGREQFLRKSVHDLRLPEEFSRIEDELQNSTRQVRSGPWHDKLSDGRQVAVALSARDLRWTRASARLVIVQDLSKLLNAEEKFRILFEHSSEAHLLVDHSEVIDCNESAVCLLRAQTKNQIVGKSLADFVAEDYRTGNSTARLLQQLKSEPTQVGSLRFDAVYSRFDGTDLHVAASFTTIPLDGRTLTLVGWHDLTERREAQEALLRTAVRLRVAQAIARLGNWEYDIEADRLIWSDEALRICGFPMGEATPTLQSCARRVHPEDVGQVTSVMIETVRSGGPLQVCFRFFLPDGSTQYLDCRSRSQLNESGEVVRISGTILDVTEQKEIEAELRQALAEKELLLKEVHHRVKNNLQVISSLLSMQIDSLKDEHSVQALRESQRRIASMGLIHERLYSDENVNNVDFGEYTETLVQELFHAYGAHAQNIFRHLDLDSVPLNIEKAIPCGLILNELVTNALKHAFPSGIGTLHVSFKTFRPGSLRLCVSDTGIGLPEDLNLKEANSLGLPLVEVLARQLGGVLEIQSGPGATFMVEFPI